MGHQISQQLLDFAQSILLGLSAGIWYDLLRPFRLRFPRCTGLLDSSYCLSVGAAGFQFLLQCTEGEFRAFALLGATGGAVLYFCAGTALLQPVWAFWADTLFAWGELLLRPVRALWQLGKKFVLCGKNLFYFWEKYYTMVKSMCIFSPGKEGQRMAKTTANKKSRASAGPLTVFLLLILLGGVGLYLHTLQAQVADAQDEKARLTQEVSRLEAENEALTEDISKGTTPEMMSEIARTELGLVESGEYVFDIVS